MGIKSNHEWEDNGYNTQPLMGIYRGCNRIYNQPSDMLVCLKMTPKNNICSLENHDQSQSPNYHKEPWTVLGWLQFWPYPLFNLPCGSVRPFPGIYCPQAGVSTESTADRHEIICRTKRASNKHQQTLPDRGCLDTENWTNLQSSGRICSWEFKYSNIWVGLRGQGPLTFVGI